jgi:hypothetical protein
VTNDAVVLDQYARSWPALLVPSLDIERAAAEVTAAFEAADVTPILLNGASVVDWPYRRDGGACNTLEVLVSPDAHGRAEAILVQLGFHRRAAEWQPSDDVERPATWSRGALGMKIHTTVAGATVDTQIVWQVISKRARRLFMGERYVNALTAAAAACVGATRAAHDETTSADWITGLDRALDATTIAVWRDALDVATLIGAWPTFATGLRRVTAGRQVVTALGLPATDARPRSWRVHAFRSLRQIRRGAARQAGSAHSIPVFER